MTVIPALMGAAIAVAPQASAAPSPGDRCSTPGATSGELFCSGQARIWMNNNIGHVTIGAPCDKPGAVTYSRSNQGEGDPVTCRSGTWQR